MRPWYLDPASGSIPQAHTFVWSWYELSPSSELLGSSDEFVSVVGYVSIVAIDRIRDERITAELLSEDNIVNMR